MNFEAKSIGYSVPHALLLALGAVIVFLFAQVSETAMSGLQSVLPFDMMPLLSRPYLAESLLLCWFIFSSYWFFALIDEKNWWAPAAVGFLLGYTWIGWALSMILSPALLVRYILAQREAAATESLPAARPLRTLSVPNNPRHAEFERVLASWPAVRPLILRGETHLSGVFDELPVSLKDFVNYLEMELHYLPEQINRSFFTWYGIGHSYSYQMVVASMDPSNVDQVIEYMRGEGLSQKCIREVVCVMPRGDHVPLCDVDTVCDDSPIYHLQKPLEDDVCPAPHAENRVADAGPMIDADSWLDD